MRESFVEAFHRVEVVATGTDEATLKAQLGSSNEIQIGSTASGLRIELRDEQLVDEVIAALRRAGGKLVSVQPVRQSLEDLFIEPQP